MNQVFVFDGTLNNSYIVCLCALVALDIVQHILYYMRTSARVDRMFTLCVLKWSQVKHDTIIYFHKSVLQR